MRSVRDPQAQRELNIFKQFIRSSPYSRTRIRSIRKRSPPEPDILCRFHDGSTISFELVEIIDREFARRTFAALQNSKAFYAALKQLPVAKKRALNQSFKNALIYVAFKPEANQRQRQRIIPTLFDHLVSLPPDARGQQKFKPQQPISRTIRWIHIGRGNFRGPLFDVEAAGTLGNPIVGTVSGKLQKPYQTSAPLELLAYYELQPELPQNTWVLGFRTFVHENLASSQFTRVWIFSVTSASITFVYP